MKKSNYQKVQEFHRAFNINMPVTPTPMNKELLLNRLGFLAEEIIENLQTVCKDESDFQEIYAELLDRMDTSFVKQCSKPYPKNEKEILIGQSDGFTDLSYFNEGNFTLINVEPQSLFEIVHNCNMAKVWPDGTIQYNEQGKIVKPTEWQPPEEELEREIQRQINMVQL